MKDKTVDMISGPQILHTKGRSRYEVNIHQSYHRKLDITCVSCPFGAPTYT